MLGKKILKIRKDNKMSQDQFAEILNVTRQTVSNWENEKNYPDIETLIKISNEFHISLDLLLKGDKNMIKKIDKDLKSSKIFKTITITLTLILLMIVLAFIVNKQIKTEQQKKNNQKNETIMSNIKQLGFKKDEIGFYSITENGINYKVYTKMPQALEPQISAISTEWTDEEAIAADYDGKNMKITYLNENNTTIYCQKDGTLLNENQNKNHTNIYNKYKNRTIEIVTRTVELFENIYNEV